MSSRKGLLSSLLRRGGAKPIQTSAEWSVGQAVLDDFVVERTLGEGGMGKVYLVKSRTTPMRFAVKRAKGMKEEDRRNFLAELQTWIDLPEHANLVPCRFFRTVGDEVLIFAEYVEGGSLKDWIDSKKLYEGGPQKALERILDISIQFAWGMHCVHELGVVHQDVKPGNVLMAPSPSSGQAANMQVAVQGVRPKVTDYGLARAKAAGGERFVPTLGRSIVVSSGGYTPAYCSPEQAAQQPVTRKTDIWSWGVSVLEMFTGEVTWTSGVAAADVLDGYLAQVSEDTVIPAMPVDVADVLRVCFHANLGKRWENLGQAVEQLKEVYHQTTGGEYTRTLEHIARWSTTQAGVGERRTREGTEWTDPRTWLEKALRADGHDPAEAAAVEAKQAASRRGQLVADLAVYDEVRRIYEHLVQTGRKELEEELATLCTDAAFVHLTADDSQGGLTLYDRAIEIYGRLVNQEGRRELANGLALTYQNKALTLSALGDKRGAVALYDRAIEIHERLVNQERRRDLANDLAMMYQNKANSLSALGDKRGAVALFDQAIEIRERLVNMEGRRELANSLATVYQNKADSLRALGDKRGAVALCDLAIAIWERLVNLEGHRELADGLAGTYHNKAIAVGDLGDNRRAVVLYDQAIEIHERLVNQERRRELADDLAMTYQNKAGSLSALGDKLGAMALYDRAIEIYERLVNQEGRRELADDLANTYHNKANSLNAVGDKRGAVALCDRAIAIWERLVNLEGHRELANDLATVYFSKAIAIGALGDNRGAVVLYDQAIAIRERLVNLEGRRELAEDLAKAYTNKATVVGALGDDQAAVAMFDHAIEIFDRLVNMEDRRELVNALATVSQNKANSLSALGDKRGAVALYDRAIEIRERLVNQEGRRELGGDLARTMGYRAVVFLHLGETDRGKREARASMATLHAEIERTGRADLKSALAWIAGQVGEQ